MKTINIRYLKDVFLQLYVGIEYYYNNEHRKFEEELIEFKKWVNSIDVNDRDLFFKEFKEVLLVVLNNPEKFSLNDIMNDSVDYYLKSDHQVLELLKIIWDHFYGDFDSGLEEYTNIEFQIIDEMTPL